MTGTTKTLKNGKIQYYYKNTLLGTSCTKYKYALVEVLEWGCYAKKLSNSLDTILAYFKTLTIGYRQPKEGSYLYSFQFHNPVNLKIVEF